MFPKVPAGFVKAVLAGHSALGLFFAGLIYLVCLSGTLAVFHTETIQWEQPGAPTGRPTDAAIGTAIAQMTEQAPVADGDELHSVSVFAHRLQPDRTTAHYFTDGGAYGAHIVDTQTGALLEEEHAPFAEYLSNLHIYLRLPAPWGIYLVGLIGIAMLSLVVSGILSHPRIFRDAFHFRRGGSRRLQEADLHNRLSVWALPFHLTVSFTGAFLGLSFFTVGILAFVAYDGDQDKAIAAVLGPQATEDHTPTAVPDIPSLIADARERTGLQDVNYISIDHVGTQGQVLALELDSTDDLARGELLYYGADGQFLEDSGATDGSLGAQTFAAMAPLHFGTFSGHFVKFVWFAFGVASTLVTATGVSIWMARRREQGRPAPLWERVWISLAWGGAIGCFAPALFTPISAAFATPVLLLSILAALGAAWVVRDSARLARLLRFALGLVLVAMIVVNVAINGAAALAGVPLLVNLGLAAMAALALSSLVWYAKEARTRGAGHRSAAPVPAE